LVSATDLTIIATLVQTAVITLTLLVFIFQFRSQEKAIKESSYQNLMARYNEFITSSAGTPELKSLFSQLLSEESKTEISDEEGIILGHMLIVYGILDEAYELYEKRWIDEESWSQWAAWLKVMVSHPRFIQVHEATKGMFNARFQQYVSKLISESPRPAEPLAPV
jgi:hypothetical protein